MNPLARVTAATILCLAAFPALASDEAPISDDASLNAHVAQYRECRCDEVAWSNPHLPEASAAHGEPTARAGEGITRGPGPEPGGVSGDALLTGIVSHYSRAALDRGGWVNPFVAGSHYAAGHPLLSVHEGEGVTTTVAPGASGHLAEND